MAKTQKYQISMKDGGREEVEGVVINERWGIDKRTTEVTRMMKSGEEKTSLSSCFYLTHIPSGILVTNANTQKALKELVERLDSVNDEDYRAMLDVTGDFWNERGWKG